MTLTEILRDEARRRAVVVDGALLIEREVAARGGLSGFAVKAGYKALKAVRPGVVEVALAALLPEFAPAIDPLYAQARASGDLHAWFAAHADAIADALLAVTDRRAAVATQPGLKRVYAGLRATARREVAQSVPGLGRLIEKHVG